MPTSPLLKRRSLLRTLLATGSGVGLGVWARGLTSVATAQESIRLTASGLSFATPLYESWFESYLDQQPDLRLTYRPRSYTQGVADLQMGAVDFAMSDGGISETQARDLGGGVALPMVAGAVGIAYNLPGIDANLRLSRRLLSEIYLGQIRAWNDPRIAELNPKVNLPPLPITVLYGPAVSGYSQILIRYLNAISRPWAAQVGTGSAVDWPVGELVPPQADLVRRLALTFGGITAVGLEVIQQVPLILARLENKAGKFISPTPTTIASGLSALDLPESLQGFLADPPGEEAYPLVAYTWILTYPSYESSAQLEALQDLLSWCLSEGQSIAAESGYIPLPGGLVERARTVLESISVTT